MTARTERPTKARHQMAGDNVLRARERALWKGEDRHASSTEGWYEQHRGETGAELCQAKTARKPPKPETSGSRSLVRAIAVRRLSTVGSSISAMT